jgi:hypothetical protein
MNVTINNQCSNIELVSAVCFTKDTTCRMYLSQQVDSKGTMKANFRANLDRNTFGGALLYHMQRKKSDRSGDRADEDASTNVQLLAIWGRKSDGIYSHAWLIEHESKFTWSEDKLERLYHIYDRQYVTEFILDKKKWLLDDNIKLQTICETLYGGFEMKVFIFEQNDQAIPIKPLWINSNR